MALGVAVQQSTRGHHFCVEQVLTDLPHHEAIVAISSLHHRSDADGQALGSSDDMRVTQNG